MAKQKAIVYIDGFNLYFGLKASVKTTGKRRLTKRSYWLDIQKLAESIIRDADLVAVKYFTARIKGNYQKQLRQNAFLNAIQIHCQKLQIFEGRYLLWRIFCSQCRQSHKQFVCPNCQHKNIHPEEKKSDVNIATQMMQDAYENRFDIAYLVSCDSDFVPPVKAICDMTVPQDGRHCLSAGTRHVQRITRGGKFFIRLVQKLKKQLAYFAKKYYFGKLGKIFRGFRTSLFFITANMVKRSWLPDVIAKPDGTSITIPAEWQ
jgi:uncharacterized LabA/DUF88 family protein